jgi:hypothetical protein
MPSMTLSPPSDFPHSGFPKKTLYEFLMSLPYLPIEFDYIYYKICEEKYDHWNVIQRFVLRLFNSHDQLPTRVASLRTMWLCSRIPSRASPARVCACTPARAQDRARALGGRGRSSLCFQ